MCEVIDYFVTSVTKRLSLNGLKEKNWCILDRVVNCKWKFRCQGTLESAEVYFEYDQTNYNIGLLFNILFYGVIGTYVVNNCKLCMQLILTL